MMPPFGSRRPHARLLAGAAAAPLAMVPISLLTLYSADDGNITTKLSPSGAAYRTVAVTVADEDANSASENLKKYFPGWRQRRESVPNGARVVARRYGRATPRWSGIELRRTSRVLRGLSIQYEFTERLAIRPGDEPYTQHKKDRASLAQFSYELQMPGRITVAETDNPAVRPPILDGGTARWTLSAADAPVTIRATSRQFKCWYATTILYIALWAGGWAGLTAYRRMRARPKRI
ncbi:MAG: hypothetical protein ACE5JM_10610 [Armatimonadota bacterium]